MKLPKLKQTNKNNITSFQNSPSGAEQKEWWGGNLQTIYSKISERQDSKDPKIFQRDYNIYLHRKKDQLVSDIS